MLTVTRSVGRCIYFGYHLDAHNLEQSYDYRVKVHKVTPNGAQFQIKKKDEKPSYVSSSVEEAVIAGDSEITFLGKDRLSDYEVLDNKSRNKLYKTLGKARKAKEYDLAGIIQMRLACERWVFSLKTTPELIIYRDDIIPREQLPN